MEKSSLGKNIAHYRTRAGLTQGELGSALFVSAQAVSRWERGGAPDTALLPAIADALGISLDKLFGHKEERSPALETLITRELEQTPEEKRLERAYQLAWHMMKVLATADGDPGDSYFRAMTANEELDRIHSDNPASVPVDNYFEMNQGFLQSCVAKDFHYVLIMQEPERGFASVLKREDVYRRFFEVLSREHYLQVLCLAHTIPVERNFTAAFVSDSLGLSEEEAQEILSELDRLMLLNSSEVQVPEGVRRIYTRHEETLLIPLLFFAGKMMHTGREFYYSLPMRRRALLNDQPGTDGISPGWEIPEGAEKIKSTIGAGLNGGM